MDKLREECGIFGIICDKPINAVGHTATALLSLQHRGQESAGIATFDGDKLVVKKDSGLCNDVFSQDFIDGFIFSSSAVGHVRYGTADLETPINAQPLTTIHKKATFCLAHNGSLTNAATLRAQIAQRGAVFYTTNDSEIISILIIEEMLKTNDLEEAIFNVCDIIEGAFSFIVGLKDKIIAVRDKNGFRPLCIGKLDTASVVSSESVALDGIGARHVRDILPGEMLTIYKDGSTKSRRKDVSKHKRGLCVFGFVYFARPDSFIDGISVHEARVQMGKMLYRQKPTEADLVCGVPDSGISAAYGYAEESGIPYGSAFIKNRYIGRTFIAPTQLKREQMVNVKLNPLKASVDGKRIILVDDSIVRGTTSAKIIRALRDAGAKEVHMRISSPEFKYPCYFGTDVPVRDDLISNHYSVDGICKKIGADSLEFLTKDNLFSIKFGTDIDYCGGCFDGEYPIQITDKE